MIKLIIGICMVLLTICLFFLAKKLYLKYPTPLFNPSLFVSFIIIMILLLFNIPYETYMIGGEWINHLLGSTVVTLAFPLYKYKKLIVKYFRVIFTSILVGVIVNFISVFIFLNLLGYSKEIMFSFFPKSVTTPVAIQIADLTAAVPSLTVVAVMVTGFSGMIIGPYIIKICRFQSDLAKGMALGNAAHVIGTSRAFEYSLEIGSISSAGMILSAIISSILIPLFILILF
ncbi:LrgB family protein [Neobacillus sp. YX16]|uniref:LrgB family protein n=1 Tax=Neobacillus sp. YX16 TaxID=3047874 RepID=UPI0024C46522|nr:LrgB family protein [Neobacillus sp. YX16]WHZ04184.1 LrgB family protein [Neobacillus sp. YX16]